MQKGPALRWPLPGAADILGPMAAPPDLASLAKRYVDLWQDQLIAMAADPDLAGVFARVVGELTPLARPPGSADGGGTSRPAGAAAAAAASRDRSDDLDQLARRVAALEERLAALEAGAGRGRKRAAPKRRRNSS
jgi:hypothetical protein